MKVGRDLSFGSERARRAAGERQVTMAGVAIAAIYVVLAVATLVVPGASSLGTWLPLHLLLAGAAATAISGVMPFFSAAVSGAAPAPANLRVAAVGGVAAGAAIIIGGRLMGGSAAGAVAGAGGVLYIIGLFALAAATVLPLKKALGSRRMVVGFIYGVAVVDVIGGATLGTLFLVGWRPVLDAWAVLKPAHAWLNLFGFVSLTVAGTLLHLLPTVAGTRIPRTRVSEASFMCLAAGPLITAVGFALRIDAAAIIGAAVSLAGAIALGGHAITVVRARGHWRTDLDWHRFSTVSLLAGVCWFILGMVLAMLSVAGGGASAAGWDLAPLLAPLGVGWVLQALIGAWSHLVPAVGPGSHAHHALQRVTLGRVALPRLVVFNVGTGLMVLGQLGATAWLETTGLVLVALATAAAVLLLIMAIAQSKATLPAAQS